MLDPSRSTSCFVNSFLKPPIEESLLNTNFNIQIGMSSDVEVTQTARRQIVQKEGHV